MNYQSSIVDKSHIINYAMV